MGVDARALDELNAALSKGEPLQVVAALVGLDQTMDCQRKVITGGSNIGLCDIMEILRRAGVELRAQALE